MNRLLSLLVLTLMLVGCGSSQSPVTLTYNPPDSVAYTGETITTRVQTAGDATSTDTTITYSTHVQTARDGGFEMVVRSDSVLKGTGGPHATDAVNQVLIQTTFTEVFDSKGQAVSMTGYDDFYTRLETALGPQQAASLRAVMDPELLAKRELGQWNSTVGRFAALGSMTPGQIVFDTTFMELPSGTNLVYYRATRLVDTTTDESKLCARIEVVSHTDPRLLAAAMQLPASDVLGHFAGYDSTASPLGIQKIDSREKSEWLVEVATLLVHTNASEQDIELSMPDRQGQIVKAHLAQNETKRFRY
jgi:hypothetical protein